MLGCLLDAMLNYKPEGDDNSEGVQDKFPELSEKSIDVLEAFKKYPSHNASEICEQIGLSERQVKTYITKLKQLGLIVRVGSNKTGYWRVTI